MLYKIKIERTEVCVNNKLHRNLDYYLSRPQTSDMNNDIHSRLSYSGQGGLGIHPESLAKIALSEIANGNIDQKFYNADLTSSFFNSLVTDEPEHTIKLIRKELDNGLAVQFFFEGIAPIIAEKLGDSWKQDTMTFSEVTIAVSKLRLLCQELESIYLEPEEPLKSAPKILLFTLEGENHTFGSYLAALKLKKENFNAQIAIGYSESDLFKLLEFGNFQLIGVSIGSENMVNQSNIITDRIRKNFALPIAAGGSFVTHHKTLSKTCLDVDLFQPSPKEIKYLLKVN